MTAIVLDGRALAQQLCQALQAEVLAFRTVSQTPLCLAVIQVGEEAASKRYVRSIKKLCAEVGLACSLEKLPATIEQEQLEGAIRRVSGRKEVAGVLLQMPLPAHLDAERATRQLDYRKDVDGVHPLNAGLLALGRPAFVPNTPAGGLELLRSAGIDPRGKRVGIVGRSAVVGRPLAALLLQADATVTICHSQTVDLGGVLRECEIVAVAIGKPGQITGAMLRPGATVLDFGINVQANGQVVGDVDFASAGEVVGAITPVPGGTGPITNVLLLRNVLLAGRQMLVSEG